MADSYTRLFHELLEPLLRLDLSGVQFRIILWVARNSYGRSGALFTPYSWRQIAKDLRADRSGVGRQGWYLLRREILRQGKAGEIGINKAEIRSLALGLQSHGTTVPLGQPSAKKGTTVPGGIPYVLKKKESSAVPAQPSQPQGKDPNVKAVIAHFFQRCQELRGFKPAINGGKDGKLVKDALADGETTDTLKAIIDWFLKSKKADDLGVALSTAISAHSRNLFRQQRVQRSTADTFTAAHLAARGAAA